MVQEIKILRKNMFFLFSTILLKIIRFIAPNFIKNNFIIAPNNKK